MENIMKKILLFLCLSAFSLSNAVEKFEIEYKELQKNIEEKLEENYTTIGMREALEEEYNELDKLLNKYYRELIGILSDEEQVELRESQRKWIEFRDKEYEFYGSYYSAMGGSMWGVIYNESANAIMLERIRNLVKLINYREPM